jgi:hypothetical protein
MRRREAPVCARACAWSALLLAGFVLVAPAEATRSATQERTFSVSLAPGRTVQTDVRFDAFDPGQGELVEIRVTLDYTLGAFVTVENESALPAPDLAIAIAGETTIDLDDLRASCADQAVELTDGHVAPSDGIRGSGPDFYDLGFVGFDCTETVTDDDDLELSNPPVTFIAVTNGVFFAGQPEATWTLSNFTASGVVRLEYVFVPVCVGDFDVDDDVDAADLFVLLSAWGSTSEAHDVDGSGTVGFGDLVLVLSAWGACP